MRAALLPVKSLTNAKARLGAALSAAERESLTRAMLADMIEALAATPRLDRTYVLSSDPEVLRAAADLGATPLREGAAVAEDPTQSDPIGRTPTQSDPIGRTPTQSAPIGRTPTQSAPISATPPQNHTAVGSLNRAVAAAAARLAAAGVTRLLTIPGDVPLIEPADVTAAFDVDVPTYPVVLIPSAGGAGTNGLLLSPPTVIVPRFEGDSLAAHMDACREHGVAFRVLPLPSFALDVDTPEDLAELARRGGARRSGRVLAAKRSAA